MLRLYLDEHGFYSFNETENDPDHVITSLRLKKEVNTLSELTFTVYTNHPMFNSIHVKRSCITLVDVVGTTFKCIFIGKVRSIKKNLMDGTAEVDCEDLLGCLRDSIVIPGGYVGLYDESTFESMENVSYNTALGTVRSAFTFSRYYGTFGYNTSFSSLPSVTMNIGSDSKLNDVFEESCLFDDYLSLLFDHILQYTSATITTTATAYQNPSNANYRDGVLRIGSFNINYSASMRDASRDIDTGRLNTSVAENNPDFKYGVNIVNISEDEAIDDIASVLIPYGTMEIKSGANQGTHNIFLKSGDRWNAYPYVSNPDDNIIDSMVSKYGFISRPVNFETFEKLRNSTYSHDDIDRETGDSAYRLRLLAERWAAESLKVFSKKYTLNGIDKYYYTGSNRLGRPIDIGDIIHIDINKLYDIDDSELNTPGSGDGDIYDFCLSLEVDFFNHENDTYIIGPYITDNMLEYKASNAIKVDSKKNAKKKKK